MKYTAIIIASATVAFCVQAYAKAQAYMDYTTASSISVDAIDPYENIRDAVARHEMQAAAKAAREYEDEIENLYNQLPDIEKANGDAEVSQ
nr:MAG: hypothetical protein D8H97_31605 [Neisseria sp.]